MRIDELRSTLEDHATTVHDHGAPARVVQVRGRVRAVRRRRTAALVAAAAVVTLAGVVSVPPLLDRTPPAPAAAPQTLAGHRVPATEVASGFTYRYVGGVEGKPGEDPLTLQVEVDDRPRLVAFASSEKGSVLTLEGSDGEQVIGTASGEFDSYMLLESSGQHRLRLSQDELGQGRLALAIYDLGAPPEGVTDGLRTFRQTVPGYELVDGVIGDPGETDLTTTMVLPEGPLRWDDLCHGGGDDLMLRVRVEGQRGWWGSGCGEASSYVAPDASYGGTQSLGDDSVPRGVPVRVRVWLGEQDGGAGAPAVDDPDAVLGVAAYVETGDRVRVLGQSVHEATEWFGHTWRVAGVHESARGDRWYELLLPAADDTRIVSFVVTGLEKRSHRLVGGVVGGEESGWWSNVGADTATHGPFVLLPGEEHTVRLRVTRGHTSDTRIAAVVSDRAD